MPPATSNSERSNGHVNHLCLTTKVRVFTPSSTYPRMTAPERPGASSDPASLRSHTFLLRVKPQRGRQELAACSATGGARVGPSPKQGTLSERLPAARQPQGSTTVAPPLPAYMHRESPHWDGGKTVFEMLESATFSVC